MNEQNNSNQLETIQQHARQAVLSDESGQEYEAYQFYLTCCEEIEQFLQTAKSEDNVVQQLQCALTNYQKRISELQTLLVRKGTLKILRNGKENTNIGNVKPKINDVVFGTKTGNEANAQKTVYVVNEDLVKQQQHLKTAKEVVDFFKLENENEISGSTSFTIGTHLERSAIEYEKNGDIEQAVAFLSASIPYLRRVTNDPCCSDEIQAKATRIANLSEERIRFLCSNTFPLSHNPPENVMNNLLFSERNDSYVSQQQQQQQRISLPLIPIIESTKTTPSTIPTTTPNSKNIPNKEIERCCGCKQEIKENTKETLFALDKTWHSDCFALSIHCGHCGGSFGSDASLAAYRVIENPLTGDKVPYHPACYYQAGTGLQRENNNDFLLRKGFVTVKVILPKKFFKLGEIVTFRVEIENTSHVTIKALSICLEQHTKTRMSNKRYSRTMSERYHERTKVAIFGKEKTQLGGLLPAKKGTITSYAGYVIPSMIAPTRTGDIASCCIYFMKVTAKVKGLHYSIPTVFEVTILPE